MRCCIERASGLLSEQEQLSDHRYSCRANTRIVISEKKTHDAYESGVKQTAPAGNAPHAVLCRESSQAHALLKRD